MISIMMIIMIIIMMIMMMMNLHYYQTKSDRGEGGETDSEKILIGNLSREKSGLQMFVTVARCCHMQTERPPND